MSAGLSIAVMMNNYTHDLATAVFAVSALAAWLIVRSRAALKAPEAVRPLVRGLLRAGWISLAATLALGGVRAAAYRTYEWSEAVGSAQVPALVVKHVILVALVLLGVRALLLARRELRSLEPREAAAPEAERHGAPAGGVAR